MAKEILFRGKRKDNNTWVEGYYIATEKCGWITAGYYHIHYEVVPETVGQYIGLRDMAGNPIFSDDIIYNVNDFGCICGSGRFTDEMPWKRLVILNNEDVCYKLDFIDLNMRGTGSSGYTLCKQNAENNMLVIGNLHDNATMITDTEDKWKHYDTWKKYAKPETAEQ